jgi:uncharacterized protein YbjT (DUF2867 family)
MSLRVLVTGGTGMLGRQVVQQLIASNYIVRVMSRRKRNTFDPENIEWAPALIETGEGVRTALYEVQVVIHCASDPMHPQADLAMAKQLFEAAQTENIPHLIYPSIVGIDNNPYRYYRAKLEAEKMLYRSGVPWSLLRATQFYTFLDRTLGVTSNFGFVFIPAGMRFQGVSESEVAQEIVNLVRLGPSNRASDLGGPQVLTTRELTEQWLTARRQSGIILQVPLPGAAAEAFRRGENLLHEGNSGHLTWREWLRNKYG